MMILFKIIFAFLYFNSVSPVLMYYIYDDNPNVGFMTLDNGVGTYIKAGISGNSKKQFTGLYNPKYQKMNNEHVVDSHFKVMKTPSRYLLPTQKLRTMEVGVNSAQRKAEEYRNTEAPKQWQHQQMVNPATSGQEKEHTQTSKNPLVRVEYGTKTQESPSHTQALSNQKIQPIRPKAVNADYSNQLKRGMENVFEPKPSFVQMNVRKTQMSTDSQKMLRLNNNRQLTSLTVHESQDKRQRMPTSIVIENSNGHDHNQQVMSRVLNDMTLNIGDRRHKTGEYRKRDTQNMFENFDKSKPSLKSDNMKKYIGKDKAMVKEHRNMKLARIGSHEESLEVNDTPYALFYRMNPETLDQQEGFMLMRSMEDNGSTDFTSNEKRFSTTLDEADMMSQKSKKDTSTLKLRKKLKNFSSYRKL